MTTLLSVKEKNLGVAKTLREIADNLESEELSMTEFEMGSVNPVADIPYLYVNVRVTGKDLHKIFMSID